MLISLLLAFAKAIPGQFGNLLQIWIQNYQNKNTQDMKDQKEAQQIADDQAHLSDLERRAAAGDKKAQDEIRKRESE